MSTGAAHESESRLQIIGTKSIRRALCGVPSCFVLALSVGLSRPALAADPVSPAQAAGTASVTIEVLPDGRCKVSSVGEGFRSSATYKPQGSVDGERRCAMPPVRKNLAVDLTVLLPEGAPTPGKSSPVLLWRKDNERWTGTARLSAWSDAVVLTDYRPTWLFWAPTAAAAMLAMLAVWRRRARRVVTTAAA